MKKFKKIIAAGMIAALSMSLWGCKGNTTTSSNEFVIGGSGPLTGDNASYGLSVKNGAEIAVQEINDAGGVNGMTLKLNFLDDEATPQNAISAYNKLMDEGINAFLGTVTSGACEAVTKLTHEDGILHVTPSSSSLPCTEFDNAFRICFNDPFQGLTMADFANTSGYKNIAVIYNIGDTYSKGMAEVFMDRVKENGGNIVAAESFVDNDVDFNTQLTTIQNSGAEVIFIPAYYQSVAYIANQAATKGMNIPFLGGDGWDGVLNQLEDASVIEGAIFSTPFVANDPADNIQNFVKTYQEKYSSTPDQFAADGYDGVYVIKAALEKAGKTDNEALIAAMTEIEVPGLTGTMSFTPEGEPEKEIKLVEIVNGEYSIR